jgi:hypothetical protein
MTVHSASMKSVQWMHVHAGELLAAATACLLMQCVTITSQAT